MSHLLYSQAGTPATINDGRFDPRHLLSLGIILDNM